MEQRGWERLVLETFGWVSGAVGLQHGKPQWGSYYKDPSDVIEQIAGPGWWGPREVICPCGRQAEHVSTFPTGMVKVLL